MVLIDDERTRQTTFSGQTVGAEKVIEGRCGKADFGADTGLLVFGGLVRAVLERAEVGIQVGMSGLGSDFPGSHAEIATDDGVETIRIELGFRRSRLNSLISVLQHGNLSCFEFWERRDAGTPLRLPQKRWNDLG